MTLPLFSRQSDIAKRAALAQEIPRVPWDVFLHTFRPVAGEHVGIIGPTGTGKTVIQNNIIKLYPFVTVMATKPQDKSMDDLINREGYLRLDRWRKLNPIDHPRRVIWPDATDTDSHITQHRVFSHAFDCIFKEAGKPIENPIGWAVAVDELWYMTNELELKRVIKKFLYQGRSLGHTMVLATQKPFYVPSEVYDQSTHLFFFQNNEKRSIDRLGEINAPNAPLVRYCVMTLEAHQVLYVNTVTQRMLRTRIPLEYV